MTTTESQTTAHTFRASGCVNQWHADHDDAECYATFVATGMKATA